MSQFTYEIVRDEDPCHPRKDADIFGTIFYVSRRHDLGDKRVSPEDIEEIQNDDNFISLPVYAYIHGAISLSVGSFSCEWDSGQAGIIAISKDKACKTFGAKELTPDLLKTIQECLISEVEEFSAYLSEEAYGYVIKDVQGNVVDSCFGFWYGENGRWNAEQEAKSALANLEKNTV